MLSIGDKEIAEKSRNYKESLKGKIEKANEDFAKIEFKFKTN